MTPQTEGGIMAAIDSFIPGGIVNIFNLGLGIGAILALGTIIYAGIKYSLSGDNASKQKEAREWIWAAVKGLALIALGVTLINIINPAIRTVKEIEIPKLIYDDPTPLVYFSPWLPSGTEEIITPGVGIIHPLHDGARISSVFGKRVHPFNKNRCQKHGGIDFSAPTGALIKAVMAGTFYRKHDPNGYGLYATIRHIDGSISYYAHLNNFPPNLTSGTLVSQGQVIGYVGSTGRSTGPHLHFEIRNAAGVRQNINPLFGVEHRQATQEALCR